MLDEAAEMLAMAAKQENSLNLYPLLNYKWLLLTLAMAAKKLAKAAKIYSTISKRSCHYICDYDFPGGYFSATFSSCTVNKSILDCTDLLSIGEEIPTIAG